MPSVCAFRKMRPDCERTESVTGACASRRGNLLYPRRLRYEIIQQDRTILAALRKTTLDANGRC